MSVRKGEARVTRWRRAGSAHLVAGTVVGVCLVSIASLTRDSGTVRDSTKPAAPEQSTRSRVCSCLPRICRCPRTRSISRSPPCPKAGHLSLLAAGPAARARPPPRRTLTIELWYDQSLSISPASQNLMAHAAPHPPYLSFPAPHSPSSKPFTRHHKPNTLNPTCRQVATSSGAESKIEQDMDGTPYPLNHQPEVWEIRETETQKPEP